MAIVNRSKKVFNFFNTQNQHVGPGLYKINDDLIKKKSQYFLIKKSEVDSNKNEEKQITPGPGHYDIQNKINHFEQLLQKQNDGIYVVQKNNCLSSFKSITKRVDLVKNQYIPGPGTQQVFFYLVIQHIIMMRLINLKSIIINLLQIYLSRYSSKQTINQFPLSRISVVISANFIFKIMICKIQDKQNQYIRVTIKEIKYMQIKIQNPELHFLNRDYQDSKTFILFKIRIQVLALIFWKKIIQKNLKKSKKNKKENQFNFQTNLKINKLHKIHWIHQIVQFNTLKIQFLDQVRIRSNLISLSLNFVKRILKNLESHLKDLKNQNFFINLQQCQNKTINSIRIKKITIKQHLDKDLNRTQILIRRRNQALDIIKNQEPLKKKLQIALKNHTKEISEVIKIDFAKQKKIRRYPLAISKKIKFKNNNAQIICLNLNIRDSINLIKILAQIIIHRNSILQKEKFKFKNWNNKIPLQKNLPSISVNLDLFKRQNKKLMQQQKNVMKKPLNRIQDLPHFLKNQRNKKNRIKTQGLDLIIYSKIGIGDHIMCFIFKKNFDRYQIIELIIILVINRFSNHQLIVELILLKCPNHKNIEEF